MMMNQSHWPTIHNLASVTVIEPRPELAHLLCSAGSASGEFEESIRSKQNPNLNHHHWSTSAWLRLWAGMKRWQEQSSIALAGKANNLSVRWDSTWCLEILSLSYLRVPKLLTRLIVLKVTKNSVPGCTLHWTRIPWHDSACSCKSACLSLQTWWCQGGRRCRHISCPPLFGQVSVSKATVTILTKNLLPGAAKRKRRLRCVCSLQTHLLTW